MRRIVGKFCVIDRSGDAPDAGERIASAGCGAGLKGRSENGRARRARAGRDGATLFFRFKHDSTMRN